jgi:hypothetical protein
LRFICAFFKHKTCLYVFQTLLLPISTILYEPTMGIHSTHHAPALPTVTSAPCIRQPFPTAHLSRASHASGSAHGGGAPHHASHPPPCSTPCLQSAPTHPAIQAINSQTGITHPWKPHPTLHGSAHHDRAQKWKAHPLMAHPPFHLPSMSQPIIDDEERGP